MSRRTFPVFGGVVEMAVGADNPGQLQAVPGVRLGTVSAGIKTPGRKDLVLIEVTANTHCAAVFTRNAFCAAPVTVARENLRSCAHQPRYLLINTGNANAGTGTAGIAAAQSCVEAVALVAGVAPHSVLPFSTGVIGEPLPVQRLEQAIPAAFAALSADGWSAAAARYTHHRYPPQGAAPSVSAVTAAIMW